jgi:NitT/TauT family transport system ATP-binding protein
MGSSPSKHTKDNYALELTNVGFSYDTNGGQYEVFKDVDINVHRNEVFCIIGPSGCGKTTLINIIAGFESPTVGTVQEEGEEITGVSHKRALVFQQDAVFPWLTVYRNIEYGLRIRRVPIETRKETVERLIELVRLTGFETAYPRELSGGMRKRVDLARALASDPKILLMDEPFGSLDAITKEKLQIEVTELWEKSKVTVVFITHDLEEALFLGDRIAIMQHINTNIPFKIFDVPFGRPRNIFLKEDPQFQAMRRQLIEEFKLI